jgi:hypothetical protein
MSNQGFFAGLKSQFGRTFSGFETGMGSGYRSSKAFLSSNSLVAKFVFLVLVVIVYTYLLRLGAGAITWMMSPTKSPKLITCLKDAKKLKIIPQDPGVRHAIPVLRSKNERQGIEFTWSVWLMIDDLHYKWGQRKHIFHKGSSKFNADKTAYPNNAPGLYIHPTRNALIVVMNTFTNILEEFTVNDIPLHKWVNVAIRLKGNILDVYVNGRIAVRHVFKDVPKQNYGDVFVNMNGGYSGGLADLWYHDYALSGLEIMEIVRAGPCLTRPGTKGKPFPPYFALQWYFQKDEAPATGAPSWPTDAAVAPPYSFPAGGVGPSG